MKKELTSGKGKKEGDEEEWRQKKKEHNAAGRRTVRNKLA